MLKKLNLLWLGAGLIVILSAAGCGGSAPTNEEPAKPASREQGSPPPK